MFYVWGRRRTPLKRRDHLRTHKRQNPISTPLAPDKSYTARGALHVFPWGSSESHYGNERGQIRWYRSPHNVGNKIHSGVYFVVSGSTKKKRRGWMMPSEKHRQRGWKSNLLHCFSSRQASGWHVDSFDCWLRSEDPHSEQWEPSVMLISLSRKWCHYSYSKYSNPWSKMVTSYNVTQVKKYHCVKNSLTTRYLLLKK